MSLNQRTQPVAVRVSGARGSPGPQGLPGNGLTADSVALAPAMTWSAAVKYSFRFRNTEEFGGYEVYSAIFPTIRAYDTVEGVTDIPPGSVVEQATGVAGYVRERSGATNGVALFGAATAETTNSHVWGVNTLLQDAPTRAAGAALGRYLLGAELDFNVMCPDTQLLGVSVGGNGLAQSRSAIGYAVNQLGTNPAGGLYKWSTGFYSLDGCAGIGLALGARDAIADPAHASQVPSQPIYLQAFAADGTRRNVVLQATGDGFLEIAGLATGKGLVVRNANVLLDAGQGLIIDGQTYLSDSGFSLPPAPSGAATANLLSKPLVFYSIGPDGTQHQGVLSMDQAGRLVFNGHLVSVAA